jgi:VWFA-related protein
MKLFALALAAVATTAPPTPKPVPYLESIEVTVNNVDVIVTDRAGNRVHGLQKSDFELLENNALQTISNFSEYRGAERAPVATTAPEALPQPRKFVMLFDDLSLHPATAGEFRKRTDALVSAAMQPGDELMILTPTSKTAKVLLPFTSDKRAIHDAIESVMRQSAFRANTALIREQIFYEREVQQATLSARRAGAQAYARGVSRRVKETLGHLQAVVAALAEVPGKKSVIFVTQSLPVEPVFESFDLDQPPPGSWSRLTAYLADVARTASTNGVAVYCLQPDVYTGSAIGMDVEDHGRSPRGIRVNRVNNVAPTTSIQGTQKAFEVLSDTTGGKWWRGGAGIEPLFRQISEDVTDYYSIGYRAASAEPDRTRSIAVRVRNHPEYDVRARRAVVRKSAPNEMRDMVIARLLDDRTIDELNVRVSVGKAQRELTGSLLVPVDLKVPLSKLTFLRDGDVYRASFRVHYAAESSAPDFAPGEGREQTVEVPLADMAHLGGKFFSYTTSLRVLPGVVKVSVGVLDPLSHLATIKTMTVDAR